MLYTDLNELKGLLEIDPGDRAEDKKLLLLAEQASNIVEEALNRPGMSLRARTEYYEGTGTPKLLLRSRPVRSSPTPQVFEDDGGYFGSASGAFDSSTTALTYGEDFALALDTDTDGDGTDDASRSGILLRLGDSWRKGRFRSAGLLSPYSGPGLGNVKVVYTGGYTVDTLPAGIRYACGVLVARMRYILPLGMEVGSESYEERSISLVAEKRSYLLGIVRPLLRSYVNWKW